METEFTPLASAFGGALIGLSAALLLLSTGRIAGISGIVSRLLPPSLDSTRYGEGFAFVVGLLLAYPLYRLATGGVPEQAVSGNMPLLIGAGLLVGVGTAIAPA